MPIRRKKPGLPVVELISDILIDLSRILNQQNDFKEILRLVSQQAAALLSAETSLIMMLNPRTRETVKTMFKGGAELTSRKYNSLQRQVSGWILRSGDGFLTPDITKDDRFKEASLDHLDIRSIVGAPLHAEGVVLGSLILLNKIGNQDFSRADLVFLSNLAVLASPYLRNAQQIQQFFEAPMPESTLLAKYKAVGLLGKGARFVELLHTIEAAARCDVRVMLEGQSGTGKELIARAIHQFSARNHSPFVAIDCGAIPANLMESELFGYEKGAFTGANKARIGIIEEANGGTLFVDEITNLPLDMQAKFMRVLQEKEIRPVGGNRLKREHRTLRMGRIPWSARKLTTTRSSTSSVKAAWALSTKPRTPG